VVLMSERALGPLRRCRIICGVECGMSKSIWAVGHSRGIVGHQRRSTPLPSIPPHPRNGRRLVCLSLQGLQGLQGLRQIDR